MLVLFDHGTPLSFLKDHTVQKTKDLGWDALTNGELLKAVRKIALVVLGNSRWPLVRLYAQRVVIAVSEAKPGSYTEVDIPTR